MDFSTTVLALNSLIDTCKDGEMGFRQAAEHVNSTELKTLLAGMADRCTEGAGELSVLVRHLGGNPDERGSIAGALHRGWVDLRAMVATDDDHAVLEECERGEDAAKARYRDVLGKDLPPNIRAVVDRQYQGVSANHDRIKAVRNSLIAL